MSTTVWRIAMEAPAYQAHSMTGAGAKASGGRWNVAGVAVVYSSETRALACLETVVHRNGGGLPFNRYLVEITIPDDIWTAARVENGASLPVGWESEPAGQTSIELGTDWLRSKASAVLIVPSVIVPEECNILINPEHPDHARITATKVRRWLYDPRLPSRALA